MPETAFFWRFLKYFILQLARSAKSDLPWILLLVALAAAGIAYYHDIWVGVGIIAVLGPALMLLVDGIILPIKHALKQDR